MGNKFSCLKSKNDGTSTSPITLAIIGPDNVGKTTLSSSLAGEPIDSNVAPTVGFRNVKFRLQKCDVTMYDLGGGRGIRPIWKNYFSEIYGVIYMVDSSSRERIKEARDLLRDTLEHPQVSGKPLLVLANKVDVEGHMEESDIVNQLDLDQTVNATNCPSKFLMISALQSNKRNMKKIVYSGIMWLLGSIRLNMNQLEPRIQEDMEAVKATRDKEREERRERVRKQREEREKAEEKKEELDYEEIRKDPYLLMNYNRMQYEKQQKDKKQKQETNETKKGSLDRKDLRRVKDDSNIRYSMDDSMTLPRFGKSRFGRNADLDGLDMAGSSDIYGRSTKPSALPPLEPITSRSLELKMNPADKKKGKKKKPEALSYQNGDEALNNSADFLSRTNRFGSKSYDFGKRYGGSDNEDENDEYGLKSKADRFGMRSYNDREEIFRSKDDSLGSLNLSKYGSRSYGMTESDVHDLTPRVAKPKNQKVVKAGRIDEDDQEGSVDQYRNFRMSLKEYGDPRMSQKLDEYSDRYPLKTLSDSKYNKTDSSKYQSKYSDNKSSDRWESRFDREDSMYRKSLKQISPPDLHKFDDEKDEGIEDDSEDNSDAGRYSRSSDRYGRYGKKESSQSKNYYKDVNANKRRSRYDDEDDDDDEDDNGEQNEYGSRNRLKDTMRFSSYEDHSRSKYEKEINNLKYRRDNDYNSGYYNKDSDDDRQRSRSSQQQDQGRKKKKKNILKSNKLQPSDDDELEHSTNQRYSSPRMVQERSSRYSSDADTPSHGRNAVTTSYFSKSSSRDSDFGQKWGLAEDLPAIDNDSRVRRNYRSRYNDSDEDVVY